MLTEAYVKNRRRIERQICRRLILTAISAGYTVSVHNGDEAVIKKSNSVREILKKMFSVDMESLIFYNHGSWLGTVLLVYGNDGYDCIADATEGEAMRLLLALVDPLIDRLAA